MTRSPREFRDLKRGLDAAAGAGPVSGPCPKCRGRGQFATHTGRILGPCYSCRGTGVVKFVDTKLE